MVKSRLRNHLQKKAFQNVLLTVLGIVLVIILLIMFGTKLLVSFSLLAGKLSGGDAPVITKQSDSYIDPPLLDATFEATNSAQISISGSSTAKEKINLYVNGKLVDSTTAKSDNNFTFTNITLDDGNNSLKAKVVTEDNKQSDYSNEITVLKINKEPKLEISSPSNDQKFKKEESPIKVTGQTDPNVKVTVNDFWAIVDGSGKFTYSYTLKDGDNTITVVATDLAGNKISKEVKFRVE
jgi:osmotically-inducible protein OsmY